ncbi:unnamed protein product [Didymodactylos carnosus]|uniref:2',5'-phosphodiesterase 12-like N-terminal domain-containing protein n=1 Tax=Didymodactylos carnosus TaxID=1234261 RepID=A0A815IZE6_9BILA|nr:unnamed protein product [Didymodactylos carnosus]CAF4260080.1 unnamed protein product [Didymodactylos carnosus]
MAIVRLEFGSLEHCLFDWYVTNDLKEEDENQEGDNKISWTHIHHGPVCIFSDEHVNKYVKVTCLPRNSNLRFGLFAECISKNRIIPCPKDLPMTSRHEMTKEYVPDNQKFPRHETKVKTKQCDFIVVKPIVSV